MAPTTSSATFEARSQAAQPTGWDGVGQGSVQVERVDDQTILFRESGSWIPETGRQTTFTNVFRWTMDADGRSIRLEHLRLGPDRPVHLFDLMLTAAGALQSAEPHVCREDRYAAQLEYDDGGIRLQWKITGPKKDETICYRYA
jgi:hypothetical protein